MFTKKQENYKIKITVIDKRNKNKTQINSNIKNLFILRKKKCFQQNSINCVMIRVFSI